MEAFFTTAEVAAERKCSKDVVLRRARKLHIGENLGGRAGYRFTREDIDALFASAKPHPIVRRRRRRVA